LRNGVRTKFKLWTALEALAREDNPRLVAIIEIKDARHLLKMRAALLALVTGAPSKEKVGNAKRLLTRR
jgi:hypothetical protein